MNAALSLRNRPEPTPAEQARRLEAFEIALREERIKELEEMMTSSHLDWEYERRVLTDQLTFTTNEQKRGLERNAEGLKREQELRDRVCKLLRENHQLKDTRDEFEKAGNQLANDKETLQAEVERLVAQNNAAARVLAKTQEQLKAAEAEAKRLRAMEPDRLSKLVKRLQKEKAEAVYGAKELRTKNHQLAKQNRQLDAALDKAIAQANSGKIEAAATFEPARLGRWELFTCEQNGFYQLHDAENQTSQTVRVEDSELITPKVRPVPKAIAAKVLAFHQEHFGGAV